MKATVKACSNLALIKYWGNSDPYWNIPTNDSISVSLDCLNSLTTIEFDSEHKDIFFLNGVQIVGEGEQRIKFVLEHFRKSTNILEPILLESENNFPTAAGIASSASGFGALAHALYAGSNIKYTSEDVSRLARLGSGSASRTIHKGYAHWIRGKDHETSYSVQIKESDDLRIIIAITEKSAKPVSSFEAMEMSKDLSPFFLEKARQSTENIPKLEKAILEDDFTTLGTIAQQEANNLHAVINTTGLGISYWNVGTIEIMKFVNRIRETGTEAYYTIDAGPQVKILCKPKDQNAIIKPLQELNHVKDIIISKVGFGSKVIQNHLF